MSREEIVLKVLLEVMRTYPEAGEDQLFLLVDRAMRVIDKHACPKPEPT